MHLDVFNVAAGTPLQRLLLLLPRSNGVIHGVHMLAIQNNLVAVQHTPLSFCF